jgi:hypothetical protein
VLVARGVVLHAPDRVGGHEHIATDQAGAHSRHNQATFSGWFVLGCAGIAVN